MKVLVIGGRQFLGRHIVESLQRENCEITLFNRGKTNSALFTNLETICGDRQKDFHLLKNRKWDVVIDTCGYFPQDLSKMSETLRDQVQHYIFVSSVSVYDQTVRGANLDESTPLVALDIDPNDATLNTYGARKRLCEKAVDEHFIGRSTHVRPGLIVGPHDTSYRFSYWVDRIVEGGEILAPGEAEAPLQFIDVRDLADWIAQLARSRPLGTVNAVGPGETDLTLGRFLEEARKVLNPEARFTWVSEPFLKEHDVGCWVYLPLWVYKESQSFLRRSSAKARKNGLKFRSTSETLRDTRAWSESADLKKLRAQTLPRDREKEILGKWK